MHRVNTQGLMGAYIIINMEGHISLGKTAQNSDSDSTLNRLERFVLSTELSDLHIFRFKGRGSPSGDSFRNYDAAESAVTEYSTT